MQWSVLVSVPVSSYALSEKRDKRYLPIHTKSVSSEALSARSGWCWHHRTLFLKEKPHNCQVPARTDNVELEQGLKKNGALQHVTRIHHKTDREQHQTPTDRESSTDKHEARGYRRSNHFEQTASFATEDNSYTIDLEER